MGGPSYRACLEQVTPWRQGSVARAGGGWQWMWACFRGVVKRGCSAWGWLHDLENIPKKSLNCVLLKKGFCGLYMVFQLEKLRPLLVLVF